MLERNLRILLVDDNPAIHEDYRKILADGARDSGLVDLEAELFGASEVAPAGPSYELDSAYQGREALDKVRAARAAGKRYAVAFMDVRMPPGWNGVETTRHIWQEDPDLEVVICTAYSDLGWSEIVAQLGRTDRLIILKKPFDAMEVQQLAHALTEKWYLRRQAEMTLNEMKTHLDAETYKRKMVEAELRHAQKLEAVGRLASGLAHELNTPLQFVGHSAGFLGDAFDSLDKVVVAYRATREAPLPAPMRQEIDAAEAAADLEYLREQVPEAVRDVRAGLDRMAQLVRALKRFSSVDSPDRTFTDVNAALEDTLAVSHSEYGHLAVVETQLGTIPHLYCHAGDLNQAFLALIVNAAQAIADAKATGKGKGKLRVATRTDGGEIVIEIADSGVGIPEENRDLVFEPFFTTREVGKGAGLGLSIVHAIVAKHGGTIRLDSQVGEGTTFTIRLPVQGQRNGNGTSPSPQNLPRVA
jgi:two-component system NtrC family sensor kinase